MIMWGCVMLCLAVAIAENWCDIAYRLAKACVWIMQDKIFDWIIYACQTTLVLVSVVTYILGMGGHRFDSRL